MSKWISRLYGLILLYLAVEALWDIVLPNEFLPYAVLLMGVVILFTPLERDPTEFVQQSKLVHFVRKFVFGTVLFWMGASSAISMINSSSGIGNLTPLLLIGTRSGSLILAAIAAIYFLSSFAGSRSAHIGSI